MVALKQVKGLTFYVAKNNRLTAEIKVNCNSGCSGTVTVLRECMQSTSGLVLKAFAQLHRVSGRCPSCGQTYILSTAEEIEILRQVDREIREKGYTPRRM